MAQIIRDVTIRIKIEAPTIAGAVGGVAGPMMAGTSPSMAAGGGYPVYVPPSPSVSRSVGGGKPASAAEEVVRQFTGIGGGPFGPSFAPGAGGFRARPGYVPGPLQSWTPPEGSPYSGRPSRMAGAVAGGFRRGSIEALEDAGRAAGNFSFQVGRASLELARLATWSRAVTVATWQVQALGPRAVAAAGVGAAGAVGGVLATGAIEMLMGNLSLGRPEWMGGRGFFQGQTAQALGLPAGRPRMMDYLQTFVTLNAFPGRRLRTLEAEENIAAQERRAAGVRTGETAYGFGLAAGALRGDYPLTALRGRLEIMQARGATLPQRLREVSLFREQQLGIAAGLERQMQEMPAATPWASAGPMRAAAPVGDIFPRGGLLRGSPLRALGVLGAQLRTQGLQSLMPGWEQEERQRRQAEFSQGLIQRNLGLAGLRAGTLGTITEASRIGREVAERELARVEAHRERELQIVERIVQVERERLADLEQHARKSALGLLGFTPSEMRRGIGAVQRAAGGERPRGANIEAFMDMFPLAGPGMQQRIADIARTRWFPEQLRALEIPQEIAKAKEDVKKAEATKEQAKAELDKVVAEVLDAFTESIRVHLADIEKENQEKAKSQERQRAQAGVIAIGKS